METARIAPETAEAQNRLSGQAWKRIASRTDTPSGLADDTETGKALTEYLKMAGDMDTIQEKAASENFVRAEINAVHAEINAVHAEINAVHAEINAAKTDLIKWIVGASIGIAGVVIAATSVIISFMMQI